VGLLKEQLVAQTFLFLAVKWAAGQSLPLPVLESDGCRLAVGLLQVSRTMRHAGAVPRGGWEQ